ncbi:MULTISPECIES: hypothetical protein [Streptococcus]|jgi:hypothetical protein|uniref:Uncharacterized protein n=1 Tax=Streptococcus salivarius TaxID=1304 RepID=A0AA45CQP0_STRSL|nr:MULTISPECIES: hypothetical protein [Streptococcus]MBK5079929.1 hypothetical protein [Streptococcus sp. 22.1]MDU2002268.1 hypothetical protein [Streptococcus salivarius]MDU2073545.1 hypothetical protein [Streptococcus salivarius]MDU2933467.1 hypothetical protein [Streptococcus salivarius]PZD55326.1 hypothetical protein CKU37_11260 [Streptococcus salivarius]
MNLKNNISVEQDELLTSLENELIISEDDLVFLAGSLIESAINPEFKDMGNKESDIDVFIIKRDFSNLIVDEKKSYFKNGKITIFRRYAGMDFDIEIYSQEAIDNLIKSIENISIDESQRIRNSFKLPNSWSIRDVKSIVNRMKNSIAIQNVDSFIHICNQIDIEKFLSYQRVLLVNEIDNILPDIWGNLTETIFEVSLFVTRNMFIKFMELFLVNEGETVDREKWVVYKALVLSKKSENYVELSRCFEKLFLSDVTKFSVAKETIIESVNYVNDKIIEMEIGE